MPSNLKNYRDKKKALVYRNAQRKKNYKQTYKKHMYTYWSDEEVMTLKKHTGLDRALSKILNRSVQGLQIKRSKLKRQNK